MVEATLGTRFVRWRYAKDIVRRKIMMRDLNDSLIAMVLSDPDSVMQGRGARLIAQKEHPKEGLGKLLIRVVHEEADGEKVVVSAYWARPERYRGGVKR
jgi:hypothetical protein